MSRLDNIDALEKQLADLQMTAKEFSSISKGKKIPPVVPPKKKAQPQVPRSAVVSTLREPSYSAKISPVSNNNATSYNSSLNNVHSGITTDYVNVGHSNMPGISLSRNSPNQQKNYNTTYSNMPPYRNNNDSLPPPPPPPPQHVSISKSYDTDPGLEEYLPPPSPVSSNYSELVRATANLNYNQERPNYPPIYQNEFGDYGASQASNYESLYEPINPRPQSSLSPQHTFQNYRNNLSSSGKSPTPKEQEVDALTNMLVQSISDSQDLDVFGICIKCDGKVVGESSGCTAMGNMYHVQCFCCYRCNTNLQGKPFYAVEGQPFCEVDYYETLEKCSVCDKPILDRILRATGKPYHPTCFTCVGNKFQYANQGDADVYNRICEIAKSHHRIQTFVDSMGFHCRKTHSASSLRITGLYAQALSEGITEVLKSYKKTLVEVEGLVIGNHNYTLSFLQDATLDCGFILNPNMIPYFMPLSLAQEILFIGKTVILFGFDPRKVKKGSTAMKSRPMLALKKIGDSRRFTIWEDKEAEFHEKLQKFKDPESFEVYNLRSVVREIKECVTKHLWAVAVEEAQLIHELRLMKDFYLLGRGELFLELLRLTAHMLEKPTTRTGTRGEAGTKSETGSSGGTSTRVETGAEVRLALEIRGETGTGCKISIRDMNQAFQLATRAVFLSNSADVEKFSFELPYIKPNTSANSSVMDETCSEADGWSSLILKYDFKWPLHLLFTPEVLARYNDMFRLLLRIKKTQHDLHSLWKTYKQSANFSMCQLHNKLMFLVNNLQHYMQADVLDTSFSKLMDAVNKTNDFEKLKKAHATFLADVLSQSFLTISTSANSDSPCDTKDSLSNPVFCNIMELLKLCHSFCNMSNSATDRESEDYYIRGYSERFNKLVKQLMQLLLSLRDRPCGLFLARLLMRLDYNRWLSGEAQLTQSVTNMLQ
ncbi:hypothetical protein MSG28_008663 [Choristoneura fumiferana]|uniref:Uncharacterized protein n=1 Tax=Choristoneura fumiferana TaxID=7141 RepID=A0ACC0J7I9_CHOFU|nr:hypothetical protein MSG28_008663 [Choristoneura fumiferana]